MTARPAERTLIVGMGATGLSVARHLAARGRPFAAVDDRAAPPAAEQIRALGPTALHAGGFDEALFAAADELVLSPGVPLATPAVRRAAARGARVAGDIELFARAAGPGATVVAVTGSNGKSTVTALVSAMAARAGRAVATGGNFGPPALDLLDISPAPELYALELSSFQLETVESLTPAAATVLNISPDHLDRYATLDDYARAKWRIFHNCRVGVVSRAQPPPLAPARALSFGADAPPGEDDFGVRDGALARGARALIDCAALAPLGACAALNAQAALALAAALGLPQARALAALADFRGLPHRLQCLGERRGVLWYDDSKATNAAAAAAALASSERPCVWLAGGVGKGADFSALGHAARGRVRAALLFGRDAPALAAALTEALGDAAPVSLCAGLDEAVAAADAAARPGDRVLLSPACASFDQYRDYAERGRHFAEAFAELK